MTRISGEIVIAAPVDEAFDFVADQRNEVACNPHMVRSAKVTSGPVGKGTRFRAAVTSLGRTSDMAIEYADYQRPYRLSSTTSMAWAEFSGTQVGRARHAAAVVVGDPVHRPAAAAHAGAGPRWQPAGIRNLGRPQAVPGGAADCRAGPQSEAPEQPGGAEQPSSQNQPGQGWAGAALLAASVAGVPIAWLALRRLGPRGGLLVGAGCGVLFAWTPR